MIDADQWTVEWAVSGVVLGYVAGTFNTQAEAMFATFEMSRQELLGSLKRLRATEILPRRRREGDV